MWRFKHLYMKKGGQPSPLLLEEILGECLCGRGPVPEVFVTEYLSPDRTRRV